MSATTLDTLKLVDALEQAQMPREQARAIVEVVRASHDAADVATKGDLRELELRLRSELTGVRGELATLKWMFGFMLAGVATLVLKAFF